MIGVSGQSTKAKKPAEKPTEARGAHGPRSCGSPRAPGRGGRGMRSAANPRHRLGWMGVGDAKDRGERFVLPLRSEWSSVQEASQAVFKERGLGLDTCGRKMKYLPACDTKTKPSGGLHSPKINSQNK